MKLSHSVKIGLTFGMTSAVVTTLALMVGLSAGTHSRLAVVGGIIVIAVADALSDSLAIHVSEESEGGHSPKEVWESTFATFGSKFIVGMSFVIPVILLELDLALKMSIIWGFIVLGIVSYALAGLEHAKPWKVVSEHLIIAAAVVWLANLIGNWVAISFGAL